MKPVQIEILLFTNTRFSSRQHCAKYDTDNPRIVDEYSNLEEACWDGILQESMPELYWNACNKELVLWKITEADHFLELEYGMLTKRLGFRYSLNPYLFLGFPLLS